MNLPIPGPWRTSWRFIALSLGLVCFVIAWMFWPQPAAPEAQMPLSTAHTASSVEEVAQPSRAPAAAAVTATPRLPPAVTVPVLQQRADAGDLDAAFELGWLLLNCRNYEPIDRGALEDSLIDAAATDTPFLRLFTGQADGARSVQLVLDLQADQAERCADRELPEPEQRTERGLAALEHAATSGHGAAQLAWVLAFRVRWADPRAVVRSGERVRIERERARTYLRQAMAARLPEALLAQSIAHRTGDLDAREPMRALAYWRAWRQLGSPGSPAPAWLLDQADASNANGIAAEDMRAADAFARQLVEEFKR